MKLIAWCIQCPQRIHFAPGLVMKPSEVYTEDQMSSLCPGPVNEVPLETPSTWTQQDRLGTEERMKILWSRLVWSDGDKGKTVDQCH